MRHRFDGYNWLVRLDKGEKLAESLNRIVKKENIKTGWIFGLGATTEVEIGFYDLKNKTYKWKKFDKELEILSLQGNISFDGEDPKLHLHGSFSDENMDSFGGHVKELIVGATCELFIHDWFSDGIGRSHDEATGLKLLDL